MKTLFAPLAEADMTEIWHLLAVEYGNAAVAERQVRRFFAACERLAEYPLSGRARDDLSQGLRYLPIDDYLIFYRVQPNLLEVARILHGRRDIAVFFE